ncbi:unnamed protein product [Ascophyllum nodosum]
MAAYMKEAAPKNDSKFDFLQSVYWEARGTDGVGEGCSDCPLAAHRVACKVVCRHRYRTSCQAERNFSTLLKQVLSDMRAGTLAHKTDKIDAVARAQQAPYSRICEGRTGTSSLKGQVRRAGSCISCYQNARAGPVVNLS